VKQSTLQRTAVLLACGGGLGWLKPGPGTWGSLGAAAVALSLALTVPASIIQYVFAGLAVVGLLVGLLVTPAAQRYYERLDPSQVVIDEIHGLWLAMALLPGDLIVSRAVMVCVVVFVAFRLFDICKPWPTPILERAPGAWGVMLDDSFAGFLTAISTLVLVQ
jgi:phosphatidylglycerophosphatase A